MNLTLMTPKGEIIRMGQITESAGYGIAPQDILHFPEGTLLGEGGAIDVVVLRKRFYFHYDPLKAQPELRLTVDIMEDP